MSQPGDEGIVRAPWSDADALRLIAHQENKRLHPLTCPTHSTVPLDVYNTALRCEVEGCDYRQTWVPTAVLGGPNRG